MTLGLSTRAKKALAHLRVETPDQLRHHAGQMNAGVEFCLISIPRCGWNTVIEIMEWCGEPLSHHAQMVADRARRDERPASPAAAALSEAQATIARLEAENARLRDALAPFADAAEECDDYGFDDMNQAPVDAGLCREARAALSPREGEG